MLPTRLTDRYLSVLSRRWPGLAAESNDLTYQRLQSLTSVVTYIRQDNSLTLSLRVPNEVCRYRAETFETKEPETLRWIDQFGGEGAFYDIGANVGLYSLYYAQTKPGRVYAFEPSALNLRLLSLNISDNHLASRIVIVPNPLTETSEIASFRLSMLDEGGSMSTFGQDFGHDGSPIKSVLEYDTIAMSLDFMLTSGLLSEPPSLIKIDVDGIEHLILRGAQTVLASQSLRSILIEVNEDFRELCQEVCRILEAAGFRMMEREHSGMFEHGAFSRTFNQVWVRPIDHGEYAPDNLGKA